MFEFREAFAIAAALIASGDADLFEIVPALTAAVASAKG